MKIQELTKVLHQTPGTGLRHPSLEKTTLGVWFCGMSARPCVPVDVYDTSACLPGYVIGTAAGDALGSDTTDDTERDAH